MLLVGYIFAIRSERQICAEIQVNLASGRALALPAISWPGAPGQGARHVPDTERCNCRGWYRYRQELFPHRGPR
ncbi:MAG: hypothetical protein WA645_13245 [Pseudolabrys sp.]